MLIDLTNSDQTNIDKDCVEKQLELEHDLTCEECGSRFDTAELLEMHSTVSHGKRGTKRHRQDTSLVFDPRQCNNCNQSKLEKEELNEEKEIVKLENDKLKTENEKLKAEQERRNQELSLVNAAYEETKYNFNSVTKELNEAKETSQKLTEELAKVRQEMRNIPNSSTDFQDILRKKNEQHEIVKEMVVDRDKTIKRMEEAHKKEVNILQREKKASDDSLSCVTEENTKLKDKEKTLLDIFKCMKQYMDEQLNKCPSPDVDSLPCSECEKRFTNIGDLNFHKRNEHLLPSKTCKTCNFQAKDSCEFENHAKTHTIVDSFACKDCNFTASSEDNLSSHKITKHPMQTCDYCHVQANSKADLDKHILEKHGKQKFQCDECPFADFSEENVLNHKIANHAVNVCELCDFETTSIQGLNEHIQDIHKQTKFSCTTCSRSYKTHSILRDHINSTHRTSTFTCDYCGHKANSLGDLDTHIEAFHRISKPTSRNRFSRDPCDFKSPQHKSSCCDRDQGQKMKIYTPEERIENGPCRKWNENFCKFADLCRFAHIQVCNFQESCRNPSNCRFFHFNKSNITFLCGTSYRAFVYNKKDFPPLQKRN